MPATRYHRLSNLHDTSLFAACDRSVVPVVTRYIRLLELPVENLRVTTSRKEYGRWLGRRIASAYGGAYCYLRREGIHAVLINLERIDTAKPWALEVVVAEELVHMRDNLDGDHRRHAKHGHDRIAARVAELTGASLGEIQTALVPVRRRPYRYIYACPSCDMRVPRKRRGTWSCSRCAPGFDRRFILRIVEELPAPTGERDVQYPQ